MEEQLPEGWVKTTLEEAVEIRDDLRLPINADERSQRSGPYPYYGATGQVGWINDYLMDGEYVLLGEDGAPFLDALKAKAYIISGKCWVNNHAHVLHILEGMGNNRYLMYVLNTLDYYNVVSGTTRLKLTQSAMRQLLIPLAPLSEQHRIVAAIEQQFTRLDSAVASLKSAQARIKQYHASLLKSAVEGEMTKTWRAEHPADETGEQLLKRVLIERRKRWEEQELAKMREKGITPKDATWKLKYNEPQGPDVENLPDLPEGWCWATMEQVIIYLRNGLSQKPEVAPPGYRILRINAVRPMKVDLEEVRYLSLPTEEAQNYIVDNGDVLFTRYNGSLDLLGVAGVVKGCTEPTLYPDKIIRAKAILRFIYPLYMEISCNIGTSRAFIESKARTTAGQKGISGSDIKQVPIPLPPLAEQEQIIAEVEARLSNIAKLEEATENNLKRAEHERQSILQEAFAGRLVPQDPDDEPASVLLERIREERKQREEVKKTSKESRKGGLMGSVKKRQVGKSNSGQQEVDLYKILVTAGQPLPPDELFKQAGLQVDEQPESVEIFYAELHIDVEEGLIRVLGTDDVPILLEALEPSAEAVGHTADSEAPVQLQEMETDATNTQMSKAESDKKTQGPLTLWDL